MEDNAGDPLADDFSLGDVMKQKTGGGGLSKQTKNYIIIGSIAFIVVIALVIIIVAVSSSSKSSGNASMKNNTVLFCYYDVDTTQREIPILNEDFQKKTKMNIFINQQLVPFSKQHKFDKLGEQIVVFDILDDLNMDYMFKDIQSLTSVEMYTKKNVKLLSMKSAFENCQNLEKVNISGLNHLILIDLIQIKLKICLICFIIVYH